MKKRLFKLFFVMIIPIILLGCNSQKESNEDKKVTIIASISPLKEFAEIIGGDKVNVSTLVPENADAHHIDFGMKDLEKLMASDVFIYNGLGMEEWLPTVMEQIDKDKVLVVNTSEGANARIVDGTEDPHMWLSLKEAQVQCENIKNALVKVDPDNRVYYENNYNTYKEELNKLYNEYTVKFNEKTNKDFITTHAAFGYLCRDFGLKETSLNNLFGEGEATAKRKGEIVNYCKENGINVVFSESSESEKDAETISKEINGSVQLLYSLETKVEGKTYLEAMKENLEKIYVSLK